jgi:hypothetical protein
MGWETHFCNLSDLTNPLQLIRIPQGFIFLRKLRSQTLWTCILLFLRLLTIHYQYVVKIAEVTMGGSPKQGVTLTMRRHCNGDRHCTGDGDKERAGQTAGVLAILASPRTIRSPGMYVIM